MHQVPRHAQLLVMALLAVFATPTRAQPVRPAADRLDAIVSYPVVIALHADDERDLRRGVTTRLDDGRTFTTDAYWIGISPRRQLPVWTASGGIWTATDYETIARVPIAQRPRGAWFTLIPLPVDAVGQGLWFGPQRHELNWLPDPERSLLEAGSEAQTRLFDTFWSAHLDAQAMGDPAGQRAIAQLHADPFQNWRARLLTDGLHPDRSRTRETHSGPGGSLKSLELELAMDTPGADLLGAIARQHEARWRIILGRVWLIDPEVATRLKAALMRTARFGDRVLPLWGSDTTDLSRLAYDLLSPFVNDKTRVLRASAWLEAQPRALAWISDDQGDLEAGTGRFLPTLSVIALPQSPGASLLRIETGDRDPVLRTLEPGVAVTVSAPVAPRPMISASTIVETSTVELSIARWSTALDVIASPIPARAPYIRIGPLLNDWTMDALVNARPLEGAPCAADRSTVGILRKTTPPSRTGSTLGWSLYIECASPEPGSPRESLTLWAGPREYPFAAWSISPDATATYLRGARPALDKLAVETRVLGDRWVAMIDLPPGVFGDDASLQLGLERTDAHGIHSAWPRRMIPGQPEPGRLLIEAGRFDQLRQGNGS